MIKLNLVTNEIKRRINLYNQRINELKVESNSWARTPDAEVYRQSISRKILMYEVQRDTLKVVIGELPEEALLA